jgi:hypothetical protein
MGVAVTGDPWSGFYGTAVQAAVLLIGGLWALYLYKARREGQTTVRLGVAVALVGTGSSRELLVRIHIVNSSSRQLRHTEATLTLLSAPRPGADGNPVFTPLHVVDPLVQINGEISDPDARGDVTITEGTFPWYSAWFESPSLEPGECVDSEVALSVDPDATSWSLRLIVDGKQGRIPRVGWYDWGVFAILSAELLTGHGYLPVTSHMKTSE